MECPDCGYHLPPFETECVRCKRLGSDIRLKRCPDCGKLASLAAVACEACGHAYRTAFPAPARLDTLPVPQSLSVAVPTGAAPPDAAPPGAPPPVVNIFINHPLAAAPHSPGASRPGRGWIPLMVLLATPFGWIGLIVLLVVLVVALRVALIGLPIIAAILAVLAVARLDSSRLDPAKKPALIASLLALGFVTNAAFWWIAFGHSDRSAPRTVSSSTPAPSAAPDTGRPHRRFLLRRLFRSQ